MLYEPEYIPFAPYKNEFSGYYDNYEKSPYEDDNTTDVSFLTKTNTFNINNNNNLTSSTHFTQIQRPRSGVSPNSLQVPYSLGLSNWVQCHSSCGDFSETERESAPLLNPGGRERSRSIGVPQLQYSYEGANSVPLNYLPGQMTSVSAGHSPAGSKKSLSPNHHPSSQRSSPNRRSPSSPRRRQSQDCPPTNFRQRTLSMPSTASVIQQKKLKLKRGSEDNSAILLAQRIRSLSVNGDAISANNGKFQSLSPGHAWKSKSNESNYENHYGSTIGLGDLHSQLSQDKKYFNVALLGSSNVGKNSLAEHFDNFHDQDDDYEENQSGRKIYLYAPADYEHFTIRLYNEFSAKEHFYKFDGVILVYSVTDSQSFNFVKEILEAQEEELRSKVVIIVGNKTDLERSRKVTTQEGRDLATKFSCKFIEASTLLGLGIDSLQYGLSTLLNRFFLESNTNSSSPKSPRNSRRVKRGSIKNAQRLLNKILSKLSDTKSKSCLDLHNL